MVTGSGMAVCGWSGIAYYWYSKISILSKWTYQRKTFYEIQRRKSYVAFVIL